MNILYALLFTQVLHGGKVNPKRIKKTIKKESKFWIELTTEIVQVINIIIGFIFSSISTIIKKVCQSKTVDNKSINENSCDNIIDFAECKAKKVK